MNFSSRSGELEVIERTLVRLVVQLLLLLWLLLLPLSYEEKKIL